MNMNFNIGKNTNKINTTNSEIKTESEENNNKNNNEPKQKMMKFMLLVIGIFVIILLVMFLVSLFTKKEYSYDDIEKVLTNAAKSYFAEHKESLPQTDGEIVEIDVSNLVMAEKMKDLTEYTKEGIICAATVQVEKNGSNYLYTPFLNCGENYVTKELYKELASEDKIVTSGYGLYQQNGTYVYRGEEVNNYLELDKALWRIIKITANNDIVLIKEEETGLGLSWDNRYNTQENYTAGINNYSTSRIKDELKNLYENNKEEESILSSNDKTKLVPFNLCTGKRTEQEEGKDNTLECSEVIQNQNLGLLTLSDYMTASIDSNCKAAKDPSCQNYNYLVTKYNWWLVTAKKGTTSKAYYIDKSGRVKSSSTSSYASMRPVVYLNNKVLYKSGNGTKEKPYKIK